MNKSATSAVNGLSNPNLFINGCWSVNQRGKHSFSSGSTYMMDRMVFSTKENSTIEAILGYSHDVYGRVLEWKWLNTSQENVRSIEQRVENVRSIKDQATMSLNLHANQDMEVEVYCYQSFGATGDEKVALPSQTLSVTKEKYRYVITFSIPSIAGKVIDEGSSFIAFGIRTKGTAEGSIFTSEWKLEHGDKATPFIPDLPSENLEKCQRYAIDLPYRYYTVYYYQANNAMAHWMFNLRTKPSVSNVAAGALHSVSKNTLRLIAGGYASGGVGTGAFVDAEL